MNGILLLAHAANCYRGKAGSRLSQVSDQLRAEHRSAVPETYFKPPETRQKILGNTLILKEKRYWLCRQSRASRSGRRIPANREIYRENAQFGPVFP
jgi:hypothetical protein